MNYNDAIQLKDDTLESIVGGALTYKNEAWDMNKTLGYYVTQYPELGPKIKSALKNAGYGSSMYNMALNTSLKQLCAMVGGEAKAQALLDSAAAE